MKTLEEAARKREERRLANFATLDRHIQGAQKTGHRDVADALDFYRRPEISENPELPLGD
jgi:hypothetical protein